VIEDRLTKCLDDYPDFPKKGILFKDILPVLQDVELFKELSNKLSKIDMVLGAEALIGIDARGFIFGAAVALLSGKPFLTARKQGKLPGELICSSYDLEYGQDTLCLQKKAIQRYSSFCIIDDLLATGGTASAVESLLIDQRKSVTGLCVIVELTGLLGRSKMKCEVASELKYD